MNLDIEKPRMNHIDIKITYACNFKCEYCYQADENGRRCSVDFLTKENAKNFVEFCRRLGESFHVTLAGGEPFVYPYLQYLAENLTQLGNFVNLITNFSAPMKKICEFIDGCNDRLEWFNISVHLSQWKSMEEFYRKLQELREYKEKKNGSFLINLTCVVTKENFQDVKKLYETVTERFIDIPLHLQRVKYKGVYDIYSEDIEKFLQEKGVTVSKEEANHIDFFGKKCWGGKIFLYRV